MRTLLLVLFSVAWAAVAFGVLRALVIARGYHRNLATATAFAVAAAFALGALMPFSLWRRGPDAPAPAPAVAIRIEPAHCPSNAKIGTTSGLGHVDTMQVANAAAESVHDVEISRDSSVVFGGWALSSAGPSTAICVVVDGRSAAFSGQYGIDRPDVAKAVNKPEAQGSGFTISLRLPSGSHTVAIGVAEADGTVKTLGPSVRIRVK